MLQKFEHISTDPWTLFFGQRAGSAGESSALLILLCGAYLIARKMMDWRIPAAMLSSAFLTGALFHLANPSLYPSPWFVLFSGGLMLGAMFMATDPVASPVTPLGMWIYGALMGLITVLIRFLGGLAEGVMYSILLGNALSPLIDKFTQPRPYGAAKKSGRMSPSSSSSGFPMIRTLTVVSLLCGLLIVVTDVNTRDRIRHNQEIIMRESVAQLLPGIQKQIIYAVEPSGDLTISSGIARRGAAPICGLRRAGRFLGVVIEASERGYADVISAMYAYDPDKKIITGFKVIDMKETPGLGSRIRKRPRLRREFQGAGCQSGTIPSPR